MVSGSQSDAVNDDDGHCWICAKAVHVLGGDCPDIYERAAELCCMEAAMLQKHLLRR